MDDSSVGIAIYRLSIVERDPDFDELAVWNDFARVMGSDYPNLEVVVVHVAAPQYSKLVLLYAGDRRKSSWKPEFPTSNNLKHILEASLLRAGVSGIAESVGLAGMDQVPRNLYDSIRPLDFFTLFFSVSAILAVVLILGG